MKKILSLLLALTMLAGILSLTACGGSADPTESESVFESESISQSESESALTATVTVTVAVKGAFALCRESVFVSDRNGDGKLDVDETLYAAHEAGYEGGAASGYASATHCSPPAWSPWAWAITIYFSTLPSIPRSFSAGRMVSSASSR